MNQIMTFRLAVEKAAISSANPQIRARAVARLIRQNDICALMNVLKSKYIDAVERAELGLAGYNWK